MSVYVIAEAGMNHDGNLDTAIRLAEEAAAAGADAVKFQLHDADAETVRDAPSPPYFKSETRYDYFRRTAFSDEQWRALRDRTHQAGIEFVCSAFSIAAIERLDRIGVDRHKIASGEVTNLDLVRRAAESGRPVIISSGMSSWSELDAAVATAREQSDDVSVLQCSSAYPCPPEQVGLNVIADMRERYGLPVGFSDHTEGPAAALAAVALGASLVEKHLTLSKDMYGPDAALSAEPLEFRALVDGIRAIERMLLSPVDKDDTRTYDEMKRVFEKSVAAVVDIPAGTVIEGAMVAAKKPGTGIPARHLADVVGARSRVDIRADSIITEADVEWSPA